MKTMLTFSVLLLLPALSLAAPPAPVQAPMQAPGKAVQAPQGAMQAPAQAPAKTAMVPANNTMASGGYRTYSYQPATTTAFYNNYYGSLPPAVRSAPFRGGFNDAGYKVRGDF